VRTALYIVVLSTLCHNDRRMYILTPKIHRKSKLHYDHANGLLNDKAKQEH